MNRQPFQAGDKVRVQPGENWECETSRTLPRLVPGRVYCVESINVVHGCQWLRLVGTHINRRICTDERGVFYLAFQLVHRASGGQPERREAA